MSIFTAALLGLIQAATEFLPVSSTAHLLVFGELFGQRLTDDRFRAFTTIIQTGTTLAVIAYFRSDLIKLAQAAIRSIAHRSLLETAESRLAWFIVLGTIPAALAGKLLEHRIEALGNWVIAGSLVVLGLVLLGAELSARHTRTMAELGALDAILVGVGQAAALVPGGSRSGCTMTAGMLLGFRREDAARFSFLLSVPIILGAGLYKLKKDLPQLAGEPSWRSATLVGTAVAAVGGYFVIGWLLRYLRTRTVYLFVVWRIVAGVAIALLIWRGILPSGSGAPPPPQAEASAPQP
jgi:undecaprenyl-diphosphatase